MIKLKIGDNYLLTTYKDALVKDFIIYTMGCFKGKNKILLGFDSYRNDDGAKEYLKVIKEEAPNELYILIDSPKHNCSSLLFFLREVNGPAFPKIKIKLIKIRDKKKSREFKIAQDIFNSLEMDDKNILHHLDKLDDYKKFAARFKAIPGELKVVNDNLKQMSKTKKVTDKIITVKDLDYLNLISGTELNGDRLIVTIKPLPIYPSESLGRSFTLNSFEKNPYLAKVAEYIYKGGHFGMVGTRILIRPNFTPEFLETLDHKFDDMFVRNNWSNIGYLHFGKGHLCGGEFNDVIAHTIEHGLEYYFISLKQYITTANMRDYAGRKIWWYPIYDDNNKLIYCAGLDILREDLISHGADPGLRDMSWEEFLAWKNSRGISFSGLNTPYNSDSVSSYSGKDDQFLAYCKIHNPKLYEELKEGAE